MNVVLILAKEGSLGLPGKNIWRIQERTLLEWTIIDAQRNKRVDKIFVSTNGEKTGAIAKKAGAEVIMRHDELAKNEKYMEAVDHAIEHITAKNKGLEIIAIPQCVVPFRDPDIFDKCIKFLLENPKYDSVVTIRRTGYIPEALMKIQGEDLVPYFPEIQKKASGSRQDSEGYEIDHTVECFTYESWLNRDEGIKPWNYLGKKIKGIKQEFHNPNCFVDVHTAEDAEWLKFIITYLGFQGMKRISKG
jgi:CMP-N-acetylneuraminic acid synthetase